MLLPQITSTAHTSSFALHSFLRPTSIVLRPRTALSRRPRSHKQIRTFRIGIWSSYLDPDFQREAQRRQRTMRQKYMEALSRKLSWDRPPSAYIKNRGLKNFMCSAWNGHSRRPGGRWINLEAAEALRNSKNNKEGGIEEVEQTPVDRLLKDHNDIIQDMIRTRARLFGSNWFPSETSDSTKSDSNRPLASYVAKESKSTSQATNKPASSLNPNPEEFEIDPITNRKVYTKKASSTVGEPSRKSIDIPIQAFEQYRSQFYAAPRSSDEMREILKDYETKANEAYSPVYYREPDGKEPEKACTVKEGLKEFDDKSSYGPVYYKEPDGRDPETPCTVQAGLKDYDDRTSYGPVYYKEPDGRDPEKICSVQQGLSEYDSKNAYGPVYYKEPDGKDPVKPCPVQQGLKEYDDRTIYGPVMYLEPDGKAPVKPCTVKEGLKDFDAKANYGSSQSDILQASKKLRRPSPEERIEDLDLLRASDIRAAAGASKRPRKETEAERATTRKQLEADFRASRNKWIEDLKLEHSEISNHVAHARGKVNAKIAEVEAGWPEPSQEHKLTGNFSRDFPEEFQTTWSTANPNSETLVPKKVDSSGRDVQEFENMIQGAEKSFSDSLTSAGISGQGPGTERIQPSLDRSRSDSKHAKEKSTSSKTIVRDDKESRDAKNLEKQNHTNLVREVRQIYEDAYGTIDTSHRQVPKKPLATTSSPVPQPEVTTLYKILAYDPTMQSISEAETTSIVADSASPLTPAEVLLRLSNPAKFFPHFAPLQSQGYEIVSGSGDVLVFRKVRSEAPPAQPKEEPTFVSREYTRFRRNPIDGMEAIIPTGNFASPTGFVNYDLPGDEFHEKQLEEPPFISNIDVRREETVFSGKPNWEDGEQASSRKKKGRGKRLLVGALWVAGCSYAVGVVAEFFKTGGVDGLGPKGF